MLKKRGGARLGAGRPRALSAVVGRWLEDGVAAVLERMRIGGTTSEWHRIDQQQGNPDFLFKSAKGEWFVIECKNENAESYADRLTELGVDLEAGPIIVNEYMLPDGSGVHYHNYNWADLQLLHKRYRALVYLVLTGGRKKQIRLEKPATPILVTAFYHFDEEALLAVESLFDGRVVILNREFVPAVLNADNSLEWIKAQLESWVKP
jgi:hypothetical protein